MHATHSYEGTAYVASAGKGLAQLLGGDILRTRAQAELAQLRDQLALPGAPLDDPCVQSITAWHDSFLRVLRDPNPARYPNPREVTRRFASELESLLHNPEGVDAPFPAELFTDRPMPIIQFIVAKMRNPLSIFYSEHFDQEAIRALAEAGEVLQNQDKDDHPATATDIPLELLEQLRQIEAINARRVQEDTLNISRLQGFRGRLHQRKAALQEKIDRIARENREADQQISVGINRLQQSDLEQRAIMTEAAERLRREAQDLRADTARLQRQLDTVGGQIGEIERSTIQLQVEINQLKADIADKKSGWLEQVICIAASIVVSWILEKPVIITPNGASF